MSIEAEKMYDEFLDDDRIDYFEYSYDFEFDFSTRKLVLVHANKDHRYRYEGIEENYMKYGVFNPLKTWIIHVYIFNKAGDRLHGNIIKAENMVWDSLEQNFGVKMAESMQIFGNNVTKCKEMEEK